MESQMPWTPEDAHYPSLWLRGVGLLSTAGIADADGVERLRLFRTEYARLQKLSTQPPTPSEP
jgi:hypothetical protein